MLALARHPTPLVKPGTCYGRLDLPLAETGCAEMVAMAGVLAGESWTEVVSSRLSRCRIAADFLGAVLHCPVVLDDRLLELDFGAWEGLAWDDVPRTALDDWAALPWGFTPPGGESTAALVARVRDFYRARHNDTVIVVTHGGPLKVLAALVEGRAVDLSAPSPGFASVRIIGRPAPPEA